MALVECCSGGAATSRTVELSAARILVPLRLEAENPVRHLRGGYNALLIWLIYEAI